MSKAEEIISPEQHALYENSFRMVAPMNRLLAIALLLLTSMLMGCTSKPVAPIPYLEYKSPQATNDNKKLLIMLRGLGGGHEIFEEHGLIDNIFANGYAFDVVVPAAHFGYYRAKSLSERLHNDIILPAREKGYEEFWIAGTSMGGLGALMYLTEYPGNIEGVILLSPYLGWGGVLDDIEEAGGLKAWTPGPYSPDNWQMHLWSWLWEYDQQTVKETEIYLGYGDIDFFTQGQKLLSEILPSGHTTVVSGGHTYRTLRKLWSDQSGGLVHHLPREAEHSPFQVAFYTP
jgi:hypothetical protein